MTDWFRSWHGAPTDPKWLGIAKRAGVAPGIAVAVAWSLMDRASQAEDRGSIDGYDAEGMAYFFGCEPDQVDAIVLAMSDKGMITAGRFASWEKRQPKREDDSSQRVREYRERKKQEAERGVTQCNTPDTESEKKKVAIANAMDADLASPAPVYVDAKHELWGEGPPLLESLGIASSRIRPMIGRWCRDARDDCAVVLGAIRRARDGRVQEPVSWITRAIATEKSDDRNRQNRPKSGADSILAAARRLSGDDGWRGGGEADAAGGIDAHRDGSGVYRFDARPA